MRILIVSATSLEIAPLVSAFRPVGDTGDGGPRVQLYAHRGHDLAVLTTGVGMVATASWCADALTRERYDVALNLGTCGSFHESLTPGTVVHVVSDRLAELGAEDHDRFIPIEKLMLLDENEFPFTGGQLVNVAPPSNPVLKALAEVRGISVNTVHGNEHSIAGAIARWHADVESMEGAAFMYACLTHDTAFAQVRAVSNLVGPRDRSRWAMAEAIANLGERSLGMIASF